MSKQRVFLTGATGTMGFLGMQELLKDSDELQLVILARPSDKNKQLLEQAGRKLRAFRHEKCGAVPLRRVPV